MNNSILISEILAEMFYMDTGVMAPYKSVAPEMAYGIYQDREAWNKKYADWEKENINHIRAVIKVLGEES